MKAPAFWHRAASWQAKLLWPLGAVYGASTLRRLRQTGARMPCPVICVGNPTVGGAGKTPTVEALAHFYSRQGKRPVVLSRGYGGRLSGPVVVEPDRHCAADVGDEPLMLAQKHPVVVAKDRLEGGRHAACLGDIIIMDDGFQNPALHKDLSLLIIDAEAGFGNGAVFPAGPLRAPWLPQLQRAQMVLMVGDAAQPQIEADCKAMAKPLFRTRLTPPNSAAFKGQRLLAFCGIGRPEKFHTMLMKMGADVTLEAFADHHAYDARDCLRLLAAAEASGRTLVTTEKDAVKLACMEAGRKLLSKAEVIPVSVVLPAAMLALLPGL